MLPGPGPGSVLCVIRERHMVLKAVLHSRLAVYIVANRTDSGGTVPTIFLLYRRPAPMRFCTDLLAHVRSGFSAPSARARGRGRSRAPGEFCGSVEPRLYFPRVAATACVIEGRVAPRCNGRKVYTVYLLKIRQVKNNYCSG